MPWIVNLIKKRYFRKISSRYPSLTSATLMIILPQQKTELYYIEDDFVYQGNMKISQFLIPVNKLKGYSLRNE